MNNMYYPSHDTSTTKINIDELYEHVKVNDRNILLSYQKILERIHKRIKTTSKQKNNLHCCWYVVPEIIIGIPRYDMASCLAFLIDQLTDNKFKVKYTHPNLLFISWNHWIPDYVRSKIKKETGMEVDGNGDVIEKNNNNVNNLLTNKTENTSIIKDYKPVQDYKPSGGLIYNNDLLKKLEDKL